MQRIAITRVCFNSVGLAPPYIAIDCTSYTMHLGNSNTTKVV